MGWSARGAARRSLGYFFFASAEQVPAPQLACPAPPFDGGFFPAAFFFGFAAVVSAVAVLVSAGAGVAAAVADVPEAALVAGAVAVAVESVGAGVVAAGGVAAAAAPLFAPQLAAEHDACPAAAVGAAVVDGVALAGVCGGGLDPPHPMRAPAPSAARVLAKA
jgi:hypothetical protein